MPSEEVRRKSLTTVYVEWADAHADEGGSWVELRGVKNLGEYLVASAGLLLPVGLGGQSGHVSIAQSWGLRDDVGDHIIHIPVGMIRTLRVLSRGRTVDPDDLLTELGHDD
jgi:hypothetical protein